MISKKYFSGIQIWLCITIFYCYQYILRVLPGNIMPELLSKFSIGASEYGTFVGSFYISYVAMQIPVGALLSRYGAKKIIPIFMIFTFIGLVPIIYTQSWYLTVIGRFISGLGASAAAVGGFQAFRIAFKEGFGAALGLMLCVSLALLNPILQAFNSLELTLGINLLIVLGMVLSILTFFVLPKEKRDYAKEDTIGIVKSILSNRKIIFISILSGLMISPLEGFADGWASSFLSSVYSMERSEASSIGSLILTGLCIGSVLTPYVAEKTGAYYGTTFACALIMLGSFLLLISPLGRANLNRSFLKVLFIAIGISSGYQVVILSKISLYVKEHVSGIATALANMIFMAFGSIFHLAIGFSMESMWDGTLVQEIPFYSPESYVKTMSIIPIGIGIAAVGFLFMIKGSRRG